MFGKRKKMKIKRSDRLVEMTYYFLENPFKVISLTEFSKQFQAAKSSISEDLVIIKKRFEISGIGKLETFAGASGGAKFIPVMNSAQQEAVIVELVEELDGSERLLPGGFVFLTDIISLPKWMRKLGRVIASNYMSQEIDTVMTVATSGIPIAQSVAYYLNVPFTIVSRDSKVTEGTTVSVNYVSGSLSQGVGKMELSRRSLNPGARVLIVDDFVKSGGTIEGMKSLLDEFEAQLVGATVLVENTTQSSKSSSLYESLVKITAIDHENQKIRVSPSHFKKE